jgi:hypothetical protein
MHKRTHPGNIRDERERSLAFMANSDAWPVWPYLPLDRTVNGKKELGYLMAGEPTRVYLGNVFAAQPTDPYNSYENLTAIVNAGWRVN